MAKKKRDSARAPDKKHKATVMKLEGRIEQLEATVERANAKVERWKKQAKQHRSDAAASRAEVAKLEKKLAKSRRKARSSSDTADQPAAVATVDTVVDPAPGAVSAPTPDASWTVTALKAEARSRGIAGYSRKSKADLIAALA